MFRNLPLPLSVIRRLIGGSAVRFVGRFALSRRFLNQIEDDTAIVETCLLWVPKHFKCVVQGQASVNTPIRPNNLLSQGVIVLWFYI